jgi:hypothetical protein
LKATTQWKVKEMAAHLIQTPPELHQELEAAATRYAAMSHFVSDSLLVPVTKLRDLGMVTAETWAQVPAGGSVRVTRNPSGEFIAKVMLPTQRTTDGKGLGPWKD